MGRIAFREHLDAIAIDDKRVAVDGDLRGKPAMCRIECRQVGIRVRIAQIVEGNDLDLVASPTLVERAQNIATDAAISIDSNPDCHLLSPC